MCRTERKKESITAVILSGGLGTRLRNVVPEIPKVLAEVSGRPFLIYLLEQLICENLKNVVLCTGYKGDQIYKTIGAQFNSLKLTYSREEKPMGTGGALRKALKYIYSDPILVLNGDSYINADITAYLEWFFERDRQASLLLAKVSEPGRYGQVKMGDDHLILKFAEKERDPGTRWINAGVYLLKKSILSSIPSGRFFSLERDLFPKLVEQKFLYGYACKGEFLDIGTPESYDLAEQFFQNLNKQRN